MAKPPSLPALLLGLIPFAGIAFSVAWWDRVRPAVLGLPFNIFWLLAWSVITPAVMTVAYRIERKR